MYSGVPGGVSPSAGVTAVIVEVARLAFLSLLAQNGSAAVAGVNAGSAIAVSVLKSTETAQAQQVATLFSSLGIGGNVSASA